MTALYWPDFDCTEETRRMQRQDTVHLHARTEDEACRAYLSIAPWPLRFARGDRYY